MARLQSFFGQSLSCSKKRHTSALADDFVGQASVVDGDTLEIHGIRIRLWGIDAPESSQLCRGEDSLQYRCGAQAANDLDAFIAWRPVKRVAALVYVAALGPDETETSQGQQDKFPKTDVFNHIEVGDGRVWVKPDGVSCFAGDLSAEERGIVYATHFAPALDLFTQKREGVAWRSKPSWSIVATEDRTVHPELERFAAKRMGAKTVELKSSHVPMLSQQRPCWT